MDRKEACEQIILLPKEKQLLKRIRRSKTNGLKCSGEEVEALESYGLVEPIREKYKVSGSLFLQTAMWFLTSMRFMRFTAIGNCWITLLISGWIFLPQ